MDQAIIIRIVGDLGLPEAAVAATVALFEAGATTPFVSHYRKERCGGLDEAKVRAVEERLVYYREVLERRSSLLKTLAEAKKLTEELQSRINSIYSKVELDDLFHLFKPRKKTKAAEAQEKGLEPLADYIWSQEPDAWSLEEHADVCINAEKQVASREQALQGATDIIAEWIAENLEIRAHLREMLWKEGHLVSTVVPAKAGQKTKYTMYYDRRESVTTVPSHRVLAIRRGTKEGVLTSAIECDQAKAIEYLLSAVVKDKESAFAPILEVAARDAYSRILKPLIETEVRAMLKERADREAIRVFQDNLSNLLLTPPAGALTVLGVDLGKADECRLAILDDRGKLLEEAAISLRPPKQEAPRKTVAETAVVTQAPPQSALEIAATGEAVEQPTAAAIPSAPLIETAPTSSQETLPEAAEPVSEQSTPAPAGEQPVVAEVPPAAGSEADIPAVVESAQAAASSSEPEAPQELVVGGSSSEFKAPQSAVTADASAVGEVVLSPVEPTADVVVGTPPPVVVAEPQPPAKSSPPHDITGARTVLTDLVKRHSVRAIAIGSSSASRNLESLLRQIIAEENIENIFIAAVNDAGIAIYASSRVAREEVPDLNVSARCAVSLARRLQDPLAELVKIDPKLIGVGQYQHDVDQKELHRGLLQTVRSCVNNVGVDPNHAGHSLLRYVSGFNDKLARKVIATRNSAGPFASRAALLAVPGMEQSAFEHAVGFLRIRDAANPLDRSAIHLESYPIVEKMAASLGVEVEKLVGNRELVSKLNIEEFVTEKAGLPTLKDIREELLRPGRDPRRTFAMPKFRADVKDIGDLKEGMTLEGTVTNVTNFGAFVDVGVRQDGLVHLSQMSNRFIRDPREAAKVGDVVQVKVISVEAETKRIGLSIKALLPVLPRKRKKMQRRPAKPGGIPAAQSTSAAGDSVTSVAPPVETVGVDPARVLAPPPRRPNPRHRPEGARRLDGGRRPQRPRSDRGERTPPKPIPVASEVAAEAAPPKTEEPKGPEPTLQEKIALLQSKFRGIS